jgi:hypothetical protein
VLNPTSALPRIKRPAGSGVVTTRVSLLATTSFSPLEIGALAEVVVVANWSKVVQLAGTAQLIGISMKSKLSTVPTGPKAARNAASPEIVRCYPGAKELRLGRIVLDYVEYPGLGDGVPIWVAIDEGQDVVLYSEKPVNLRTCCVGLDLAAESKTPDRGVSGVKRWAGKGRY